jgi:hypothetical protein
MIYGETLVGSPRRLQFVKATRTSLENRLAARDRLVAKYGEIRPPAPMEVPFDTLGVSEQDLKDIGIL